MAEGDTVGTASVNIEAIITVNEESLGEAKATIAQGLNADVSTEEGRPAGRGRGRPAAPAAATVDTRVSTKLEGSISKDVQSAIDATEYQLTIDTTNLREQIERALRASFDLHVNLVQDEGGSAARLEHVGTAHGAATTTGGATTQAPIPQEITQLLRENKGSLATNINNLYRNINEAFTAAGKGRFGKQSIEGTGKEVQKLAEIMERFGSTFGDLATLTKTNKLIAGSLSPKELGAALNLDPAHPAIQTVAQSGVPGLLTGGAGDPARKVGVLMSRVANWAATAPTPAPAAAAEPTIPVHEQRAMDTTARVAEEKQRADTKQAVIAERQASLRITPLTSEGFPKSPPYAPRREPEPPTPAGTVGRATTPGNVYTGRERVGAAPPTPPGEDPEADALARRQLGGRERANVRRLRGYGTQVSFGTQAVTLEDYLRAAEMGRFQDVYEEFGGKGGRESRGLQKIEAQDVGGFDELTRLGKRPVGAKFNLATTEGSKRVSRVGPQEALIRTIIKDLGIQEDSASAEQVREALKPQAEKISKATGAGAKPLQGTSGETRRGQGAVEIEGTADLGKESIRLFEFMDYLDGRIKNYSETLDRVNTDIEKMSGSGQDVSGLEAQAQDLSKEIQRFRGVRADAQRQREVLAQEPQPVNREATRLQAERSRAGVAAGVGFTDLERHERDLALPGAQGAYGAKLLEEMGLENGPATIRSALLQRHLANRSRIDPATGLSVTGRSTIRQAAFGPTGRAPRNPGEDAGVFGELVSKIPADMGPDARKTLVTAIRDLLTSTIEDEGFKRDIAETDIQRKEGVTLRPVLTGMTGEGQYTKTPPGIIGSLRARIEREESLPPGHGPEAHGNVDLPGGAGVMLARPGFGHLVDTHEELEDVTQYGVGVAGRRGQPRDPNAPGGATVIPGLRSQLRALEERDEIIAIEEEKAMRTRNASIARSTGLSGAQTEAMAREAGITMEPEENAPPFAAFAAKYGGGGAGAGGTGVGGPGAPGGGGPGGGLGGITGGAIPVFVVNWPTGWSGGAREMRQEGTGTANIASEKGTIAYSAEPGEEEPLPETRREAGPREPRVAYSASPGPVAAAARAAEPGPITSFEELEAAIGERDRSKLYLRWTPDLEKERQPGYSSRHSIHRDYREGGVSAMPLGTPEENYRLGVAWSQAPEGSAPRQYHLIQGEPVLDVEGKPAKGMSNESLLQPESIEPVGIIERELAERAQDASRSGRPMRPRRGREVTPQAAEVAPRAEPVTTQAAERPADPRGAQDQKALERAMEQDFVAALRGANDDRAQQAYEKRVEQREQKYLTGTSQTPAERNFLNTLEKINKPQPVAYSADPEVEARREQEREVASQRQRDRLASQEARPSAAEADFLAALQQANRPERAPGRAPVIGVPSRERARQEAERAGVQLNLPEEGVSGTLTTPPLPTVLRANAARQRAQRSLPQRAISTSFVQIAENLFGGLDAPQQRLATLANRTQDINRLGDQQTRLREQRRGTLGEVRLLQRGAAATEAAGGDAREQRARIKGLTDEFLNLTKTSKQVNSALISGAEEVSNLAASAVTATDVVRNLAAGAVGGVVGGLAAGGIAQATQAVIAISGQVLGPVLERLSGFGETTGRVQGDLAKELRASNDKLSVTLSQTGIVARLSDEQLAQVSQPLGQRAQTVAGTQSLQQQFDLFNVSNAISQQTQGGFDRSLTRATGGMFDVRLPIKAFGVQDISIGGQASTAEVLTNQLQTLATPQAVSAAAGAYKTVTAPGLGEEGFDIGKFLFGGILGGEGQFTSVPDTEKQQQLIAENTAQLDFLNSNFKTFHLVQEDNTKALDKQAILFAKGGAADLGGRLRERGVIAQGVETTEDVGRFLQEFAAGPKLSARQMLETERPQIQAQINLEDMQRRFQVETVNPQTFAMAEAARPLGPAAAGINTTGLTKEQAAGVNAELATTQELYDQIADATDAGTEAAKKFVAETFKYDPKVGEDFAKSLDIVAQKGKEITAIEVGLQTKQAAYSAAQFAFQIDIAKRSLADAKGLVSGVGDSLGAVERRIFDLQRQGQSLSLGQSQRQINFQMAVANFQAPGLSSEEAEARIEQAKVEADYAQKQLDIQKKLFGLGGIQFNKQADRQVKDLKRQLDLLERGRVLSVETATAEKKIIALTKIQAKENKNVETFYNAAVTRTADVQTEITKLVAATSESMADVGKIVLDAFKVEYEGFIDIVNGGSGEANTGTGQGHGGSAMGNLFMDDVSHAEGWMGSVSGKTSFGKYGVAGEAGGEAVAILRDPKSLVTPMGGGGDTNSFTVVIHNPVVKSDDDKRRLIADVKRALQSEASMLLPRRA